MVNRQAADDGATSVPFPRPTRATVDATIALLLLAVAAIAAFAGSGLLPPVLRAVPAGNDVWFEADIPAVFRNLTDRWSDHSRNANHPLFPLLGTIPVYALRALGLSPGLSVRLFTAAVAGCWVALLYVALRAAGRRRSDALLFTAVGACSAAPLFWLLIPESVGLASVTILVALIAGASRRLPMAVEVAVSAATLSVTVTNWMAGILVSFARLPWRTALQVSANALCVVVIAWTVQRQLFPTADFFAGYASPRGFLLRAESGGPLTVGKVLLIHSAVAPEIGTTTDPKWGALLTMQHAAAGSAGRTSVVATASWILLLVLGAAGIRRAPRPFLLLVTGIVAGQLTLHALYGEESFLYVMHLAPVLITLASFSVETRARRAALLGAALFIVAAAASNGRQLATALEMADTVRTVNPAALR